MAAIEYRVSPAFIYENTHYVVDGVVPVYDGEGLGRLTIFAIESELGEVVSITDGLRIAAIAALERAAWRAHDERNGRSR